MIPYSLYRSYEKVNAALKYYINRSTRMSVERSFGSLKGRFRRLKFIDMPDMKDIIDSKPYTC